MFTNDIIDRKIEALLDFIGQPIDEREVDDLLFYSELKRFAEKMVGFYIIYTMNHI